MSIWSKANQDLSRERGRGTELEQNPVPSLPLQLQRQASTIQSRGDNPPDTDNLTDVDSIDFTNLQTVVCNNNIGLKELELTKGSVEERKQKFLRFRLSLVATIASKAMGYTEVSAIISDFKRDTGMSLNYVAQLYNMPSAEAFLHSKCLHGIIEIQNRRFDGKLTYIPRDNAKFRHIRDATELGSANALDKNQRREAEKLALTNLPENREDQLEGRIRLVNIVNELGGQCSWPEVQTRYNQKFEVPLNSEELKKHFKRDKVTKILYTICYNEFEVFTDSQQTGLIVLRLKSSYTELIQTLNESKKKLNESKQLNAESRRQPLINHKNEGSRPRKAKVLPLSERMKDLVPVLPGINLDFINDVDLTESAPANNSRNDLRTGIHQQSCGKFQLSQNQQPESFQFTNEIPHQTDTANLHTQLDNANSYGNSNFVNMPSTSRETEAIPYQAIKAGETNPVGIIGHQVSTTGPRNDISSRQKPTKYTSRVKDGNYTESEVDETDDNNNIVTDSDSDSDVSQARKDDNDRIGVRGRNPPSMFNRDVHVSRSNTPNQSSTRNTEQINESRVIENGGLNGQTNLDTHKSEPRMMDKWLVKQKKSEKFTTQTNAAKNPSTSLRTDRAQTRRMPSINSPTTTSSEENLNYRATNQNSLRCPHDLQFKMKFKLCYTCNVEDCTNHPEYNFCTKCCGAELA